MKIVHALAYYGGYLGGIQVYVKELAKRQKKAGHKVKVITSDILGNNKKIDGVQIIRSKTLFSAFRVPFTPSLPILLLKEKCDVLHVHLPLPWLDLCVALKKIIHPKTKLVVTIHNYIPVHSMLSGIFAAFHNQILIKSALNRADVIITTTNKFADSLSYRIPKEKHKVIPLGVDTKVFYPSRNYNKKQVIFVGRIIPEKGLHVLVKAMKLVRKKIKDAKLIAVYAENNHFKGYERAVLKDGKDFLIVKKNLQNGMIRDYYAKSACCVMPSIDLDSFGFVLLEAMACECPVICSNLPGPSSIIRDDCGIVVPKGNVKKLSEAIIYMLKNGGSLRKNCRKYVKKNFSWGKINKQILEVYRR